MTSTILRAEAECGPDGVGAVSARPAAVVHADWSTDPAKRWMATAVRSCDVFEIGLPHPVGEPTHLVARARTMANGGGVVLGFDFPIGVPAAYAHRAGIVTFREAITTFGSGRWKDFYEVARNPADVAVERPFYPLRPAGTRQSHLTTGLGVPSMAELRRRCEQACPDRGAACVLFWTLGGNQVGRAAISGWRDVVAPAVRSLDVALWPFDGDLESLVAGHECVITETYPADACVQLGLSAPGRGWSKRNQAHRARHAGALLAWASRRPVVLSPVLQQALVNGFGSSTTGEDAFDAAVGLFAMLDVLLGLRPAGAPTDPKTRTVEGWILGQSSLTPAPVAFQALPPVPW